MTMTRAALDGHTVGGVAHEPAGREKRTTQQHRRRVGNCGNRGIDRPGYTVVGPSP